MEMPGAPRALREQGRRSFGVLLAGCLKCESEFNVRARPRHNIPPRLRGGIAATLRRKAVTEKCYRLSRDRMQLRIDRDQAVRHQLVAEQPGLFTRGLGGVAAQQREQRLDLFRRLALAARQRAFDDAALEPARIAGLE